jgi:hypothetical protein
LAKQISTPASAAVFKIISAPVMISHLFGLPIDKLKRAYFFTMRVYDERFVCQ